MFFPLALNWCLWQCSDSTERLIILKHEFYKIDFIKINTTENESDAAIYMKRNILFQ